MQAVNDLENIGDIIETNLVRNGLERVKGGFAISGATRKVITDFHGLVSGALDEAIKAVTNNDPEAVEGVVNLKGKVNEMAHSAALHEAQRLVAEEPDRLPAYTVETGIFESLKRIYYFAKRLARTAGES
jgi:phosphate:Na+ symporter